jgi:hypothetical protein
LLFAPPIHLIPPKIVHRWTVLQDVDALLGAYGTKTNEGPSLHKTASKEMATILEQE